MAKPKGKPAVASGWVEATKGVLLGIRDGKLVARGKDGSPASVPAAAKTSATAERLGSAIDFLEDHARTTLDTVETWMLRSLPVPRGVLEQVIADAAWLAALRDLWVVPVASGKADRGAGGFFRGVDAKKGIGVVDRDGETAWLTAETVLVPHPVLLDEVDDLRQMAVEIGATQGVSQLFRETFAPPAVPPADPMAIDSYANAQFAQLAVAIGLAKKSGYRVRGGAAICRVLERGRFVEARYELGEGDPVYETTTGNLAWVDDKQKALAVAEVPPVAFSEGMRMAALIFAKRKTEGDGDDDA